MSVHHVLLVVNAGHCNLALGHVPVVQDAVGRVKRCAQNVQLSLHTEN